MRLETGGECLEFNYLIQFNDPNPNRDIRPIIPVTIGLNDICFTYPMLIDSGSYWTGLPIDVADEYDIDLNKAKSYVGDAVGGKFTYYQLGEVDLCLAQDEVKFKCPMILNEGISGWSYGILGRQGFFNMLKVGFKLKDLEYVYVSLDT